MGLFWSAPKRRKSYKKMYLRLVGKLKRRSYNYRSRAYSYGRRAYYYGRKKAYRGYKRYKSWRY